MGMNTLTPGFAHVVRIIGGEPIDAAGDVIDGIKVELMILIRLAFVAVADVHPLALE